MGLPTSFCTIGAPVAAAAQASSASGAASRRSIRTETSKSSGWGAPGKGTGGPHLSYRLRFCQR